MKWWGKSLNLGEWTRQLRIRGFYRFRFVGIIIGPWSIGVTHYSKSPSPSPGAEPTKKDEE